jgi:RHS repeat-associated protein
MQTKPMPAATVNKTKGVYFFITLCFVLSLSLFTQAQTRNYVRTWDATAPETNPNNLPSRPLKDVKQATQYFDGLGRLEQTVAKGASLSSFGNFDIVVPVEYDQYGREVNKYLRYKASNADGLYKTGAVSAQSSFYGGTGVGSPVEGQGENTFYAKTEFETSPLNRVMKQMAPGASWGGASGGGRGVSMEYLVNTTNDAVRVWTVTNASNDFGSYASSITYPEGELLKTVTIDEHSKKVVEYKNKEGQVILKKVQIGSNPGDGHSGWLCTYYIYDDLAQLRAVVQPKAAEAMNGANDWTLSTDILSELTFRYEYDARGRMTMKKVPGAGAVFMVYDKRDRLVMTQDANMRVGTAKWMVTLYDDLNRPVKTGLWTEANSRSYHETQASITANYYYPFNTEPGSNWELLTETHYDNYNNLPSGLSPSLVSSGYTAAFDAPSSDYPEVVEKSSSVIGMVTWTRVKVLGTASQYLSSVTIYDKKGRAIQVQTVNQSGQVDVITNQYSFSGQLLRSHYKHKNGSSAATEVATANSYDNLGRVTKVEKRLKNDNVNGGATSAWKTVLENEYDALGQLKKKKLGTKANTTNELAKMEYEYNVRGWLLSVNKSYVTGSNSDQYFAMELGYDKSGSLGTFTPQYNGNIGGTIWRSAGNEEKRKYDFSYDAANRLAGADFNQYTGSAFDKSAGLDFSVSNLTYDANGNILSQNQKGWKISGSTFIDQLTYNYISGTNKLLNVIDGSNEPGTKLGDFRYSASYTTALGGTKTSPATDYTYDANGNLKKDLNKDIGTSSTDGISYNYLNLPSTITVTGKGTIEYIYDASGNKLQKKSTENNASVNYSGTNYTTNIISTTTYIGGFVYESKSYSNSTLNTALGFSDELKFLSHEEGRIRYEKAVTTCPSTPLPNRFIYDYFVKDHLGNVRMVLTEQKENVCYIAASVEDGSYQTEDDIYDIQNGRRIPVGDVSGAASYSQFGGKVYETNGSDAAKRIGLGAVIKVMAGDQLSITCQSYYNMPGSGRTDNNYMAITDLLGALVNSAGVAAKGAISAGDVYGYSNNTSNLSPFLQSTPQANTANAYLNWILFDEQMKFVAGGADPVNANGGYKLHVPSAVSASKNGFLYVFVSNESNYPVYFDNLAITHSPGAIVEETSYYPFGLAMAGISSKAAGGIQNRLKFNGGNELQNAEFADGSGMELYDAVNRMYDPQLGRFWQVDELAEGNFEWTPYNFAINNPIKFNDPFGLIEGDPQKPKVLEGVTVVGIRGGLWAKTRFYYKMMDQTGGNLDRIVNNSLREMMYRIDGIVRHRERVAEMTRAGDKIFLETASWFMPAGYLTKLRYLKYAANLFKLKRGGRATVVAKSLIVRNTLKEGVINGGADIVSQTINNTVQYVNSTDPNKGGYLGFMAENTNLLATGSNAIFKNPITTGLISTIGDGKLSALPGNLLGDAIGSIPLPKSLGSGLGNGGSFTLNLWGNQVGSTVTNIIDK